MRLEGILAFVQPVQQVLRAETSFQGGETQARRMGRHMWRQVVCGGERGAGRFLRVAGGAGRQCDEWMEEMEEGKRQRKSVGAVAVSEAVSVEAVPRTFGVWSAGVGERARMRAKARARARARAGLGVRKGKGKGECRGKGKGRGEGWGEGRCWGKGDGRWCPDASWERAMLAVDIKKKSGVNKLKNQDSRARLQVLAWLLLSVLLPVSIPSPKGTRKDPILTGVVRNGLYRSPATI